MSLVPVDTTSAVAVSDYLSKARDWLATAVEMTGPEQIAAAKAEIATAAEATKQLGLSKEIQDDATEMVRRAEYALGKAIRKGQGGGTVRANGEHSGHRPYERIRNGSHELVQGAIPNQTTSLKASPNDFISGAQERTEIYALADNADPEQFEAAIKEARAEGNLSRRNVARKVKGASVGAAPAGSQERRHQEAELINSTASLIKQAFTPKHVATLSPKAKARLISVLQDAIATLEGQTND